MHMQWCLRCNRPCAAPSTFCQSCRFQLQNQPQHSAFHGSFFIPEMGDGGRREPLPRLMTVAPGETDLCCLSAPPHHTEGTAVPADSIVDEGEATDDTQPYPDPLIGRLASEKKNGKRVLASSGKVFAVSQPAGHRRFAPGQMRVLFGVLAITALFALIVDGALVSVGILHFRNPKKANAISLSSPVLIITPSTVYPGQVVLLQLNNFPASTHIFLSRDIQEPVRTDVGSSLIQAGPNGDANLHMLVEDTWKPGSHVIVSEDLTTHYTASATIQIIDAGSVQPPHLEVKQSVLKMGAGLQGANTIQSLLLGNSGGGVIAWRASSDQSWLLFTPTQGVFSDSQGISVAVTRANLKAGDYGGTITIFSNGGSPILIQVKMTVLQLPDNPGPVLVATPPALSFTATDGGADPIDQLLTVDDPGSQSLSWSIASITALVPGNQDMPFLADASWLSISPTASKVAPGSPAQLHVIVHSQSLLPGVYSILLTLDSGQGGINSPQPVVVSLTVQPRCGVVTSVGMLIFSATAGQEDPGNQILGLGTTAGCMDVVNWQAFTSASWLSVIPANGRIEDSGAAKAAIKVRVGALSPGTYSGFVVFLTSRRTQTVPVQLTVLSSPSSTPGGKQPTGLATQAPGTATTGSGQPIPTTGPGTPPAQSRSVAPILNVSLLNLNFSTTQGQANPPSQVETVINSGGRSFNWQVNMDSTASSWLTIAPMNGAVDAGKSEPLTVSVNAAGLQAGTYSTQVTVLATDSSGMQVQGSPQLFTVTLTVFQPCSLQVTPTSLTFTATLLQPSPPGQNITLAETGHCAYPLSWKASVSKGSHKWLSVSPASVADGGTLVVYVNAKGMLVGQRTGQITLTATDSGGNALQNSPQVVAVTLTVVS